MPQRHPGAALVVRPSVSVHGAPAAHVLLDAVQNNPLLLVQVEVPHLQEAALVVLPSVWVHGATGYSY